MYYEYFSLGFSYISAINITYTVRASVYLICTERETLRYYTMRYITGKCALHNSGNTITGDSPFDFVSEYGQCTSIPRAVGNVSAEVVRTHALYSYLYVLNHACIGLAQDYYSKGGSRTLGGRWENGLAQQKATEELGLVAQRSTVGTHIQCMMIHSGYTCTGGGAAGGPCRGL